MYFEGLFSAVVLQITYLNNPLFATELNPVAVAMEVVLVELPSILLMVSFLPPVVECNELVAVAVSRAFPTLPCSALEERR